MKHALNYEYDFLIQTGILFQLLCFTDWFLGCHWWMTPLHKETIQCEWSCWLVYWALSVLWYECAGNVWSQHHISGLRRCWSRNGEWCTSIQQMCRFTAVVRRFTRAVFYQRWHAHPLTQRVLKVYDKTNQMYHFYLLQLLIRIEMAFDLLMKKWKVVVDTMNYSNKTNVQLIVVCMKLHNFCIWMKQNDKFNYDDDDET